MNTYRQMSAFYDYLQRASLPQAAQLLYHTLMLVNNICGWEREFKRTNQSLAGLMRMNEKTLIQARLDLKNAGLIDFKAAKKKGEVTTYSIIRLYENEIMGVNKTVQNTPNSTVELTPQHTPQSTGQSTDINIYKDKDITTTATIYARASTLYQQEFGLITGTIAQKLNDDVDCFGINWVENAIKVSSMRGRRTYVYLKSVLDGWRSDGYTPDSEPWEKGDGSNGKPISKATAKVRNQAANYSEYDR